jgi:hypothetical protein
MFLAKMEEHLPKDQYGHARHGKHGKHGKHGNPLKYQ